MCKTSMTQTFFRISMKPGTSQKRPRSGEQNWRKQKAWKSDMMHAESPFSRVHKHLDFRVTQCLRFVSTHPYFSHCKRTFTSIFCIRAKFL